MEYRELVAAYEKIGETTKRLEMTDELVRLFKSSPPGLLDKVVYLTQGKLYPDFKGVELGIADKLVVKAIAQKKGAKESAVYAMFREMGDLGLVAESLFDQKEQTTLFQFEPGDDDKEGERLTVEGVYDALTRAAEKHDKDSQEAKLGVVKGLLQIASPAEAKYIIRTITGKMRLGVRDMTILDALAYLHAPGWDCYHATIQDLFSTLCESVPEDVRADTGFDLVTTLLDGARKRQPSSLNDLELALKKTNKALKGQDPASYKLAIKQMRDTIPLLKNDVKNTRAIIEEAYNTCSDIGEVARLLTSGGLEALSGVGMSVGVPIRSMLAERLPSIAEILEKLGGRCAFEYKYDGLRIQAHISGHSVELFSRGLERITDQFPDVVAALRKAFKGQEAVVDGECIPINLNTGEILPFQVVSRRRGRKYGLAKNVDGTIDQFHVKGFEDEYPVSLVLFDCMLAGDMDLLSAPYPVRRAKLETLFDFDERVRLADQLVTSSVAEAEAFFEASIESGCEGVVAKSVEDDTRYRAGARGWQWIKYKRDYRSEMSDTVDLVVVGAFAGRGKRTGVYGGLLVAAYNREDDVFETVCKLGTGFTDQVLSEIPERLKDFKLDRKDTRVVSEMLADHWFSPSVVMEVLGAEVTLSPVHTCAFGAVREGSGLAIRFPRFTGTWRDDKQPEDATTSAEILSMYNAQLKTVG